MENSHKKKRKFTRLCNIFRICKWFIPDRGAFDVKSKLLVYKQQKEILQVMRQKNEILEEVVDSYKKLNQVATEEFDKDLDGEGRNEENNKSNHTEESLVELIDKGMELYSSIETPKEIKVLFPFEKDTAILPDNITKLLEEKKTE